LIVVVKGGMVMVVVGGKEVVEVVLGERLVCLTCGCVTFLWEVG